MWSLPDLAPQDSYSLWYTPSASYTSTTSPVETSHNAHDHLLHGQNTASHQNRRHALNRTPLARLRLDEEYVERRKENIRNYGTSWIKPPGIPKSLYQLREEKRELLEHQEAMRREALAQELAEAESGEEILQEPGMEEMEEVRDLDDDVPDADETAMTAEEEEEDDDSDGEDVDDIVEIPRGNLPRTTGDAFREALARGHQAGNGGFDDGGSDGDEGDNSQMLQEQDLVHESGVGDDMGMDQDLDADIPEAEDEYEHTDTEAELSSSEESEQDSDLPRPFAGSASMVRSDGTQNSMDLGSLISNSSQMGSSPRRASGFPRSSGRTSSGRPSSGYPPRR